MTGAWLINFVTESNIIEGINRDPTPDEVEAHSAFLNNDLGIEWISRFVSRVAPGHKLRSEIGMNVRVGDHLAPEGGPQIPRALAHFNATVVTNRISPHEAYCLYEWLHPFTDGNGRSGRAIWLWMMERGTNARHRDLGFLQSFHYQTLAAHDLKPSLMCGGYPMPIQTRVR